MRRLRGRRLVAGIVALVVAAGIAAESFPAVPGHRQAALAAELVGSDAGALATKVNPFAGKARSACGAIQSSFGVGNHLLKDDQVGFYASIWPTYQALGAWYLTSLVSGGGSCARDYDQTLAAVDDDYWSGSLRGMPPAYDQGPAPIHFPDDLPRVDDSLWMGLTVIDAYDRTGAPALLRRAEAVLVLARANWDPRHGGVYWEDHGPGATNLNKAVVSNAPAAVLAVKLYLATGRRSDLAWAERTVTWLRANLLDPASGLYDDHVDDDRSPPRLSRAKFTYNQGIMVEALALLSAVAPRTYPLSDAVSLAERSMAYFERHHSYGQPAFDVIWERSVLWLASRYHRASFTAAARRSLEAAIAAEPRHPGSLLDVAGEDALEALGRLARGRWRLLS